MRTSIPLLLGSGAILALGTLFILKHAVGYSASAQGHVAPNGHELTPLGGQRFKGTVPELDLMAEFDPQHMTLGPVSRDPRKAPWKVRLTVEGILADGHALTDLSCRDHRSIEPGHVRYDNGAASVEYICSGAGIRQNFIVDTPPTLTHELQVDMSVQGATLFRAHDKEVQMYRAGELQQQRLIDYNSLLAYDASGRELPSHFETHQDRLSIIVDASGARYPVTIDPLSTTASWSVEGNEAGARLGRGARSAGDVNGDGYSDVVISAPLMDAGFTDAGKVFVYHGGPTGLSLTPAWTRSGTAAAQQYGSQVCTACDVNGDGFSDLMIGTPNSTEGGNTNAGRVEIFHGSATGLANTPAFTRIGASANTKMGSEIGSLGDVNGDGFSDVAMSTGGTVSTATVHLGSTAGTSPTITLSINGPSNGQYPVQVAGAGDVNADGFGDVLFGIPGAMPGETGPQVKLHLGNASGVAATPQITLTGQNGSRFGQALSTAGDQDGDGDADVYIGAPFQTVGSNALAGQGFVYKGHPTAPLGTNVVVVSGASPGLIASRFMEPLGDEDDDGRTDAFFSTTASNTWRSAAGDVNGDGYADVLESTEDFAGPEANEGRVQLFFGRPNDLPTSPQFVPSSNQAGSRWGQRTIGAGDVNADGFADLLVTAPFFDNGQTDEGRAIIYFGSTNGYTTGNSTTLEVDQANAHFGMSGGPAGDVNNDGYADIIIGAPDFDNGQIDEGRVFIFTGSPSGINTAAAWTAEADQANAHFGAAVCMGSDLNDDGVGDIAVGAPDFDNGQTDEGEVFLYSGTNIIAQSTVPLIVFQGDQAGAHFGAAVAAAGNVNGDRSGDLLIGAPDLDDGHTDEGAAYIVYGLPSSQALTPLIFKEANSANAHCGTSLTGIGDIDNDGFSDVAVSTPDVFSAPGFGIVTIHRGTTTGLSNITVAQILQPDASGGRLGAWIAPAGDVNNDGRSDLLVGDPLFDGTNGTDCGRVCVYRGSDNPFFEAVPSLSIQGSMAGEQFGTSGGYVGDSEGDGFTEIVAGAPLSTNGTIREYNSTWTLGVPRPLKLYRADLVTPIGDNNEGALLSTQAGIGLKARSPLGRQKCQLVVECVAEGHAFSGSPTTNSTQFTQAQPGFTDIGAAGSELKMTFFKTAFRTRIRARLRYASATMLTGQAYGHWRYAGNILANNIGLHYTLDQFTNNGGEDGSGDGTITSVSPPMSIGIGLKAFPCPASELLFVQLPTGQRSTFMVSDLSGAYTMSGYLDSVRPTVPVGALPNGTYILSVGDGAGQRSTRFVVIH